jgi:hypothetical protein
MYHKTSKKRYENPKRKTVSFSPLRFDSAKLDKKRFNARVDVDAVLTSHFKSGDIRSPKPIALGELIGKKKLEAFNSHGHWSTLRGIRKLEKEERENIFPTLIKYPDDTPAIWVCLSARKALRYLEAADQWDRLTSGSPLTREDKETIRDISNVELLPSDIVACTDFDDGYLILRNRR